jgi:hypothetical protein
VAPLFECHWANRTFAVVKKIFSLKKKSGHMSNREYAQGVFFWFLDIFSAYSRCHMSKKWGVGRKYDFVGFKKGLMLAVRLF